MSAVKIDPTVQFYDPATNDYDLAKDPRCLYGWGPPYRDCAHRSGHACFRELGHPGRCIDHPGWPPHDRCETAQRPKNWDATGRTEANR